MDTARQVARPMDIRLRYGINTHLEDEGLATPAVISAALERGGSPVIRRQWRDGDLAGPQAIADHLGLAVRLDGLGLLPWLAARHEQGAGLSTQGRRRVAANVGR